MGAAELLLAGGAAALAAAVTRAGAEAGSRAAERLATVSGALALAGAAAGIGVGPHPLAAAAGALGAAGILAALALAALGGGRPDPRPEAWLVASAGFGVLALAVMAGDLPPAFLIGPVGAQGGALALGLVSGETLRRPDGAPGRG
jgi:hypothetical protein